MKKYNSIMKTLKYKVRKYLKHASKKKIHRWPKINTFKKTVALVIRKVKINIKETKNHSEIQLLTH